MYHIDILTHFFYVNVIKYIKSWITPGFPKLGLM